MKVNILLALSLVLLAVACKKSDSTNQQQTIPADPGFESSRSSQSVEVASLVRDTCEIYADELEFVLNIDGDSLYSVLSSKYTPIREAVDNQYSDIPDSLLTFDVEGGTFTFYNVTHLDKLMLYYIKVNKVTPETQNIFEAAYPVLVETLVSDENCDVVYIYPETHLEYLHFDLEDKQITQLVYLNLID